MENGAVEIHSTLKKKKRWWIVLLVIAAAILIVIGIQSKLDTSPFDYFDNSQQDDAEEIAEFVAPQMGKAAGEITVEWVGYSMYKGEWTMDEFLDRRSGGYYLCTADGATARVSDWGETPKLLSLEINGEDIIPLDNEGLSECFDSYLIACGQKPNLELLDYTSETDGYVRYVVGHIRNNTKRNYAYVEVEINLYNGDLLVGSTLANANNLEAGTVWEFRAPILEDSADSFKITDISGF